MDRIAGVGDEALAETVLALRDEVHYSPHRGLGQQGLFVKVHHPVLVTQQVHVVFCKKDTRISVPVKKGRKGKEKKEERGSKRIK